MTTFTSRSCSMSLIILLASRRARGAINHRCDISTRCWVSIILRGFIIQWVFLVILNTSLLLERFHNECVKIVPSQRIDNIGPLKAFYGFKKLLFATLC